MVSDSAQTKNIHEYKGSSNFGTEIRTVGDFPSFLFSGKTSCFISSGGSMWGIRVLGIKLGTTDGPEKETCHADNRSSPHLTHY